MSGMEVPGWMAVGFRVWDALKAEGHQPMEVFPAGCFHLLNGNKWPAKKTTVQGRIDRVELLRSHLALPRDVEMWSHDALDAAGASLVAYQGRAGAIKVTHGCATPDGSELWFPATTVS
jgi:hypothetical protein